MRWPFMGCIPCRMHASEIHACERYAYEIAYGRGTLIRDRYMRDTPIR